MSESWVPLDVEDVDPDPFVQFQRWFEESARTWRSPKRCASRARRARSAQRSNGAAAPPRRASFGWYTNYESRKGSELQANPFAALLWYCEPLGRQIRIEGAVEKMSEAEPRTRTSPATPREPIGAHAPAGQPLDEPRTSSK